MSPDAEDTLGCSARLLALLWGADRLGYLAVYKFFISSTTREGSALLDWLQTATLRSSDPWARELRALRAAPFVGPEPALPPLQQALGLQHPRLEEFLASAGVVVLDMYSTMCSWLADAKDDPFNSALGRNQLFTSAERAPAITGLWNYLKLPLRLLSGRDVTSDARRAVHLRLAPKSAFLDRELYESIFGNLAPISEEYEYFFAAPSLEEAAVPGLAASS